MKKEDLSSAMKLKNAEGWNQTLNDWEFLLHDNPEHCFVALYQDNVVATVTAMGYENRLAWIGMMLVQKDYRGMGLSKMLMNSIVKSVEDYASIKLDATPAGFPVYSKLGFVPEYRLNRMVRPPTNQENQRESAPKNIQLITAQHHQALIAFDQEVFGVERTSVLNYLFKHAKTSSVLTTAQHVIQGYLTGRPGVKYYQLGPLVSTSTEAAISLLTAALQELSGRSVVVDLLQDKEELHAWLESQGFVQQRELIRMYYRQNPCPGITGQQFLISGPELG